MENTKDLTARAAALGTAAYNEGTGNGAPVLNQRLMELLSEISATYPDPWNDELLATRAAIMRAYSRAYQIASLNAPI